MFPVCVIGLWWCEINTANNVNHGVRHVYDYVLQSIIDVKIHALETAGNVSCVSHKLMIVQDHRHRSMGLSVFERVSIHCEGGIPENPEDTAE